MATMRRDVVIRVNDLKKLVTVGHTTHQHVTDRALIMSVSLAFRRQPLVHIFCLFCHDYISLYFFGITFLVYLS